MGFSPRSSAATEGWIPEVVRQVFQTTIAPGGLSAWHVYELATDRLFVSQGLLKIVLFDGRASSPSHGRVNELRFANRAAGLGGRAPRGLARCSEHRERAPGLLLNVVDRAYCYEEPDHWRLPADTANIPYRFAPGPVSDALR
jgi:dTDP-4-dehydrorhamnose 3,5-epimerase